MSSRTSKPHVSAALCHLRHGVTLAAIILSACTLLQMLVFGFVHFTQVRYEKTERPAAVQPLSVIPARAGEPATEHLNNDVEVPVQRILSAWDPSLHIISDMAVSVGVIATAMLATLCLLGVAVAGGSAVPGVEKAVSAATWSLSLALVCIPWRDILVSIPFPGIFSGYDAMTSLSAQVDAGTGSAARLFALYMLMPIAAMAVTMLTLARFRAGVAEGVIVTNVSELDERLERELAHIRARGVAASAPRTVAALNEAIGDRPEAPPMPVEPDVSGKRRPRGISGGGNDGFTRPI